MLIVTMFVVIEAWDLAGTSFVGYISEIPDLRGCGVDFAYLCTNTTHCPTFRRGGHVHLNIDLPRVYL